MGRLSANWLKKNGFVDGFDTIVETGSKSGTGIKYCRKIFRQCHTIELSYSKFRAVKKFLQAFDNIRCHHGDSAATIPQIANHRKRTLFYLDAHYVPTDPTSAGKEEPCPLMRELAAIMAVPWKAAPTILIDDAHLFQETYWRLARSRKYRKADFPRVAEIAAFVGQHGYTVRSLEDTLVIEKAAA